MYGIFTINIPPMLAYIPYMDPMGNQTLGLGLAHKLTVPNSKKKPLAVSPRVPWISPFVNG